MADLSKFSEAKLTERTAKLSAIEGRLCRELINAGYGNETSSQTRLRAVATGFKLACDWVKARDAVQECYDEESARMRYHGNLKPIKKRV